MKDAGAKTSGKYATKLLVILTTACGTVASIAWTEFRTWNTKQETERVALVNQFEAKAADFASLTLRFNSDITRSERPNPELRASLLDNFAEQDVLIERTERFLNEAEIIQTNTYRHKLVDVRRQLNAVTKFQDSRDFVIGSAELDVERQDLEKALDRVKLSYVPPFTNLRIGQ